MFDKSILFVDPVTPKPYNLDSLNTGRMGGTEATVIRIMGALIKRGYTILHEQRGSDYKFDGDPDIVVTLRDARVFKDNIARFPKARHYLWMHDVVSGDYTDHMRTELSDGVYNLIAVSQWHKTQILTSLSDLAIKGKLKITPIYNPIAEYCYKRQGLAIDLYKLIYFSSPHKGLDQALAAFQMLYKMDDKFKLVVANPGYYPDQEDLPPGVTHIQKDHKDLMEEVATSLCMFYPQTGFAETFGIVYAESNALGTPVLGHNIGAAQEVLDNPKQLVNCNDIRQVIETVIQWSKGERPTVGVNPQVTLSEVTKQWVKLIEFGNIG